MKRRTFTLSSLAAAIAAASLLTFTPTAPADDSDYTLGPDSKPKEGVPKGTVTEYQWLESEIFPNTKRRYYVYVPDQYDGSTPAAIMVFQDGHSYMNPGGSHRTPTVFDNLIHEGSMPVTIGIFVDPGHIRDELPDRPGWNPGARNRSVEYDTVSADYADFLTTEIIAEVAKNYNITSNPELRATGGLSSGAIAAFTAAWHRPDQFRKVLSHVGSYTDIRGGYVYPGLIRKTERKPIRVYLQDGSNDLDNRFGNWPLANQQMHKALEFAGYDVRFDYGTGEHSGTHGGAVLPDALRWLWRDWQDQTP